MPRAHLDSFLLRHHVRVEEIKAYSLLVLLCFCGGLIGYVAGKLDERSAHREEIARIQKTHDLLVEERAQRISELTARVDELTKRTTEAATTSAEAARAATTAAIAVTAPTTAPEADDK